MAMATATSRHDEEEVKHKGMDDIMIMWRGASQRCHPKLPILQWDSCLPLLFVTDISLRSDGTVGTSLSSTTWRPDQALSHQQVLWSLAHPSMRAEANTSYDVLAMAGAVLVVWWTQWRW